MPCALGEFFSSALVRPGSIVRATLTAKWVTRIPHQRARGDSYVTGICASARPVRILTTLISALARGTHCPTPNLDRLIVRPQNLVREFKRLQLGMKNAHGAGGLGSRGHWGFRVE